MAVKKPGLAHSSMTNRFYFVSKYRPDGAAASKVDVTEEVENIVSHARGPLVDAMVSAVNALEQNRPNDAKALLMIALEKNWMDQPAETASA